MISAFDILIVIWKHKCLYHVQHKSNYKYVLLFSKAVRWRKPIDTNKFGQTITDTYEYNAIHKHHMPPKRVE